GAIDLTPPAGVIGIDPLRQLVNDRLRDVTDYSQPTCHVAVQCAVTDSEFAFISSRQNELTELVRERHQDHCAQARMHVFFRLVFGQAFENFLELGLENLKRVGDRNLDKFYAEVTGERPRVLDAASGRVGAWQGGAGYVFRAQRISCDDCGNSGIDSAAQTDHYRVEIA